MQFFNNQKLNSPLNKNIIVKFIPIPFILSQKSKNTLERIIE